MIKVEITAGDKTYTEVLNLREEKAYYALIKKGAYPEIDKNIFWKTWTKKIVIKNDEQLKKYRGKHFIYGFMEALSQSEECPGFIYAHKGDLQIKVLHS